MDVINLLKKQICLIAQPRKGSELINEFFSCLMWILKESLSLKAQLINFAVLG